MAAEIGNNIPLSKKNFLKVAFLTVFLLWVCKVCIGAADPDILTTTERQWLDEHGGVVAVAPTPDWPPLDYFDEWGNYRGFVADYLQLIEQRLNIRFRIVRTENFATALEALEMRRADVITSVSDLPKRRHFLAVTSPYVNVPIVILSRTDRAAVLSLATLQGLSVATVTDYYPYNQLRERYPQLDVRGVASDREALRMVSLGEADAVVTDLSVASYSISREGLTNLRVAGETGWFYWCGFGVRSDWPQLVSILEKGMAAVSAEEKQALYKKWVNLDPQSAWQKKEIVIPVGLSLAFLLLVAAAVLAWNRLLRQQVAIQTTVMEEKIIELQMTKAALLASEEKFSKAFHYCNEAIGLVRTDTWTYVEINEAFTRVLGYRRDEVIGLDSTKFGLWQSREDRDAFLRDLLNRGEVTESETHWLDRNGNVLVGMISAVCVDIGGEKHAVFVWRDETERRKIAEALRQEKLFTDAVLDSVPGMLYLYNDQGRLVRWNRQHQEMTGYSAAEMAQMTLVDWYRGDVETQERIIREVQRSLDGGFATAEANLQRKDGSVIPMYFTAVSLRIEGKVYFTGIGIDVTQRKQMEKELREHNEDLERKVELRTQELTAMNEELTAMNEELQDANSELFRLNEQLRSARESLIQAENAAALGRMVTGVAHEMNTPVGICITLASHLEQSSKTLREQFQSGTLRRDKMAEFIAENEEGLQMLSANAERAALLIRNFKQVAVEESSEERHVFAVKDLIEDAVTMLSGNISEQGHKTCIHCDEKLQTLGYPRALHQVLTNLITNSLVHAYDPGKKGLISFDVEQTGGNVVIVYRDDGRGMDSETQARIFNPFFTTRRSQGYSGLGMAVVFNLVTQLYKGEITCSSPPDGGVQFRIVLPVEDV